MLTRLALTIACTMACSATASARQIDWSCNTVFDATGEITHREVTIDTEQRTVMDNRLKWKDGDQSPMAAGLDQFVQVDGDQVQWGNRLKGSGPMTGVFSLDLLNGRYTLTYPDEGQLSHGICKAPSATS